MAMMQLLALLPVTAPIQQRINGTMITGVQKYQPRVPFPEKARVNTGGAVHFCRILRLVSLLSRFFLHDAASGYIMGTVGPRM